MTKTGPGAGSASVLLASRQLLLAAVTLQLLVATATASSSCEVAARKSVSAARGRLLSSVHGTLGSPGSADRDDTGTTIVRFFHLTTTWSPAFTCSGYACARVSCGILVCCQGTGAEKGGADSMQPVDQGTIHFTFLAGEYAGSSLTVGGHWDRPGVRDMGVPLRLLRGTGRFRDAVGSVLLAIDVYENGQVFIAGVARLKHVAPAGAGPRRISHPQM